MRNLPPFKTHRSSSLTFASGKVMHPKSFSLPLSTLLIAIIGTCAVPSPLWAAGSDGGAAFLQKLSLNSSPSSVLIICHGFGCADRNQFVLTPARLAMLRGMLGAAKSAKDERRVLAKEVAWLDREGGRSAGTVGRIARASAETKSGPTQMDCIDLTANITELLIVLEPQQDAEIPPCRRAGVARAVHRRQAAAHDAGDCRER